MKVILGLIISTFLIVYCRCSYSCSPPWLTVFKDSCYTLLSGNMTWDQASAQCRSLGGHLVVVTSEEEQTYVHLFTSSHYDDSMNPVVCFWMDGKDEESENHWYWDWTGQPLEYTNWYPTEPSNTGDKENCLGTHKGGIWNDYPCYYKCHAICEKELVDAN